MPTMKDLTSSVYTFSDLIRGNFLYVDKTEYIWEMIRPAKAMYFLSRPRRFGKSLTVSTLEAVFSGERELFKGLAIDTKDYDWKKYPVIHLDFGDIEAGTPKMFNESLSVRLTAIAKKAGIQLKAASAQGQFRELILEISVQEPVVVLIDEYDKPILGNVGNAQVKEIQKVLKDFYSVIKATESRQRFVFMTGVSKFAHVSVFSDLNNLLDISQNPLYATMMGYGQEELETYFADRMERVCKEKDISQEKLLHELKQWYDGYRFHHASASVYNPVSIAQFFQNGGEFNNYWFSTGTPTFLLELAKKTRFDFEKALTEPVSGLAFNSYELDNINTLALLLQTGYLTIKGAVRQFGSMFYYLDFPNLEVKSAFDVYLLGYYTKYNKEDIDELSVKLAQQVRGGDADGFMEILSVFFRKIPYDIHVRDEKYYQTIFFMLFLLIGIHIEAESRTNKGRIDAVASCGDWVYLFEFKLDQKAKIALNQIRGREYFGKYLHSGKQIVMIGVNFDSKTGEITDWQTEKLL